MKKIIIAFMLLLQHVSYGQTLFSDMDGFGNTINKCNRMLECPTYDILCTGGVGTCSSTSGIDRWYRIGTPWKASSSSIGMAAEGRLDHEFGQCEGIFTNFNFIPGKTYRIHVGIKSLSDISGAPPVGSTALKLYSGNELYETSGEVCCLEPYLWYFPSNSYNHPYWGFNVNQNPPSGSTNTTAVDLIGTIAPGFYWSGTTYDYSILYTVPTTGTTPTLFAMHTYLNCQSHTTTGILNAINFEIDYVKIEECNFNSNFDYSFTTFNPLNVTFNPASHFVPKPYDWDFGDGIHSFVKTTLTHSYPSYGSYIASLLISDEDCSSRRFAKLCLDSPAVENYIEGETGGVQGVNNNSPCNPHFRFHGSSVRAEDVNLTVLGGHTGPSAFKVVWGDGNTSTSTGPVSFMHTYPSTPATYTITVEADGGRCKASLDVCIEELTSGGGGPYGGGGDNAGGTGQGKSTETNLAIRNELMSINSLAPNPASTIIAINIDGEIATPAQIKVYDLTGKQVVVKESNINIGKNKIELYIANLANGMYLVEVKANSENILRTKFIKE